MKKHIKYSKKQSKDMQNYNFKARKQLFKLEGWKKKLLVPFLNKYLLNRFTTISKPRLSKKHWAIIKKYLPTHLLTVLDIGAGRGYFSFKFVKENYCVTAIELNKRRFGIITALRDIFNYRLLEVRDSSIDLKAARRLLPHDIVLLISVYHQMLSYQKEEAQQILEALWSKTRTCMFFAMADGRTTNPDYKSHLLFLGTEPEIIRKNITAMLSRLKHSKVTYLGDLPYFGDKSPRMFFKIERCNND